MLTEDVLRGDWDYLEGDEPLDRVNSPFWTFEDGTISRDGAMLGSYAADDGVIRIALLPSGDARKIEMSVDKVRGTDALSVSARYWFDGNEPLELYGSMCRRIADVTTTKRLVERLSA